MRTSRLRIVQTDTARKRLQRARESGGIVVHKVVLTWDDIDLLLDLAALEEWNEQDKKAVALAVPKALRIIRDIFGKLDAVGFSLTDLLPPERE